MSFLPESPVPGRWVGNLSDGRFEVIDICASFFRNLLADVVCLINFLLIRQTKLKMNN